MKHSLQIVRGRVGTFKKYLDWLAKHSKGRITPTHRLHLISDRYYVHRSAEIKRHAAALEIKLWFIPGAHTNELQPLDCTIFGAMKSVFRRRFEEQCRLMHTDRLTKSAVIAILKEIWENFSPASISLGWAIYVDDFGPNQEADLDWEE
jgi:hypothetical protein